MSNEKTIFACSHCDAQYPKWEGRCRQCGKWGTLVEAGSSAKSAVHRLRGTPSTSPPAETVDFASIETETQTRIATNINECDRVLGGGIVPGSLILLGGAPGIGKSTLILQIIASMSFPRRRESTHRGTDHGPYQTLYVSGEESATQVKMRFTRLGFTDTDLTFTNNTNIEGVIASIEKNKPPLVVIDSIQTLFSTDSDSNLGSINQVTICCTKLTEIAKRTNTPIIIVGHITKDGVVAGPKTLEHLVDVVLYLEGDKNHFYRLLRGVKNRYGSVDEVGIFEMTEKGLEEVKNPSLAFIHTDESPASGTATTVIMEGTRPLMVEIQALTSKTHFGYPKRATSGFKQSRLELLIAILTKRMGLRLGEHDVYVNVAGGLKINEPAADLAAAAAIISSFQDKPIPAKTAIFGELGLGGEIRPVPFAEKRIKEAENLGFEHIIAPHFKNELTTKLNIKNLKKISEIRL